MPQVKGGNFVEALIAIEDPILIDGMVMTLADSVRFNQKCGVAFCFQHGCHLLALGIIFRSEDSMSMKKNDFRCQELMARSGLWGHDDFSIH
jgi:hypothetical protein